MISPANSGTGDKKTVAPGGTIDSGEAVKLLEKGKAPENIRISGGPLKLTSNTSALPVGLQAATVILSGKVNFKELPARMRIGHLSAHKKLQRIGPGLRAHHLDLSNTQVEEIPGDVDVMYKLDCSDCRKLKRLPPGLKTGSLVLEGCLNLEELPEGLDVDFLDITGCAKLRRWPKRGRIGTGRLRARNCVNLEYLPSWLEELAVVDIRDCEKIEQFPEKMKVSSWVDFAGTKVEALPKSMRHVGLRWRGVPVDERIVFRPESLTGTEILEEPNVEVRRVMLERVGYERFIELTEAKVLDCDQDLGGERKLYEVFIEGDENLICVSFSCPSTDRKYVVRVPPKIKTCHAAVAWMAGFDDPDQYQPVMES